MRQGCSRALGAAAAGGHGSVAGADVVVPGGTQWQRAQQDPHALRHRFCRDDTAHARPQSAASRRSFVAFSREEERRW